MPDHSDHKAEKLLNSIIEGIADSIPKQKSVRFFDGGSSMSTQMNRLLGRERSAHKIFGGGQTADVLLWRNKKISSSVLTGPRLVLPDGLFVNVAVAFGSYLNQFLGFIQDVACGRNLKQFILVVAGLWAAAVLGSWFNFLTVFYVGFVCVHTLPVVYERYEDQVDDFIYKLLGQAQNQYRKLDDSLLSKIPKGNLKGKKAE